MVEKCQQTSSQKPNLQYTTYIWAAIIKVSKSLVKSVIKCAKKNARMEKKEMEMNALGLFLAVCFMSIQNISSEISKK